MRTYRRETVVAAPFEEVWEFHSDVEGLEALTPGWMGLRVEWIDRPDAGHDGDREGNDTDHEGGDTDHEGDLPEGTRLRLSTRPFGVGPRQGWTSRIVDRRRREGAAIFRDTMEEGPFDYWLHTHAFVREGDRTRIADEVVFELPSGAIGRAIEPAALAGFEPLFRHRHHRTRALPER